jgi:hypothetical protein
MTAASRQQILVQLAEQPLQLATTEDSEDTEGYLALHAAITEKVLGAALRVHTELGAGCLESTYDACLRYQLVSDGVTFTISLKF